MRKLAVASVVCLLAVIPAVASATVRTGTMQDPQGDASALSGPVLDLASAAVRYDDNAGTLRITWTYYGDVRTNADPAHLVAGYFSATNPTLLGVPTDTASVVWSGQAQGDGSMTVTSSLTVSGASGILAGNATLSPDGRTVTAEFANPVLVGHDWQRAYGSGAGDTFSPFWFDGYSQPKPNSGGQSPGSTPSTGGSGSENRVGMTINHGAQFTNDPDVTLSVIAPSGVASLRVANDGGFLNAQTFSLASTIHWHLAESGAERLPKTVYLRFGNDSQNYTDDIILDQTRPTVSTAALVDPGPSDTAKAAAAKRTTYRIRIAAKDATSGVGKLQFAVDKHRPSQLQKYAKTSAYRGLRAPKYVRVRDRAGNYSAWHAIQTRAR